MPAALPTINAWSVDVTNIFLNWQYVNKSTTQYYNLYGSSTWNGSYTKMIGNISNYPSKDLAAGSVLVQVPRAEFSIATSQPWFFKVTSVSNGVESSLSASPFLAVDALDTVYRERWTDDDSPVYKNLVIVVSGSNFPVSIKEQLGRDANYMTVSTTATVTMAINSQYNDLITITTTTPFTIPRHDLRIDSLWFNGSATVTIFVSGN